MAIGMDFILNRCGLDRKNPDKEHNWMFRPGWPSGIFGQIEETKGIDPSEISSAGTTTQQGYTGICGTLMNETQTASGRRSGDFAGIYKSPEPVWKILMEKRNTSRWSLFDTLHKIVSGMTVIGVSQIIFKGTSMLSATKADSTYHFKDPRPFKDPRWRRKKAAADGIDQTVPSRGEGRGKNWNLYRTLNMALKDMGSVFLGHSVLKKMARVKGTHSGC